MKKIIRNIIIGLVFLGTTSCNDFLDELPDNRILLDTSEKIKRALTSAYPATNYATITELSTDNIEDAGETNPYSNRFFEETAYWKASTETSNDNARSVWLEHYKAIGVANESLKALEKMGYPAELNYLRGEALMVRAYNHFVLVNLFSNHYNTQTSAVDLGIPYIESPETTLVPKYNRGTVKEVYEKINADIELALPLMRDDLYDIPKYHFNVKASYAFAARFNLFYEKWQKAVEYANVVLGNSPETAIRNWKAYADVPRTPTAIGNDYIKIDKGANLLIQASVSSVGQFFGAYYLGARFNHTAAVARRETINAIGPWGSPSSTTFWSNPLVYGTTNLDKTLFMKVPSIFQYTDLVAKIGFNRAVHVLFTTDETLLVRAEANIMLKKYNEAVTDLNTWSKAFLRQGNTYTQSQLEEFYGNLSYSEDNRITQKKRLQPKFSIEQGTQENLLHCVLQYRRILTLHEGLRWFDIRRYGIEVPRYLVQTDGTRIVKDRLTVDDLRRTLQIPDDVISAGLTPNPR